MELRKFKIDGKEIEFVNNWRGNRSGFVHETTLFIDGYRCAEHKCQYYNRTWERYTYQTVMRCAVDELMSNREAYLKEEFKTEHGYAKLTAKRAEEFKAFLNGDEEMQLYNAIYRALA